MDETQIIHICQQALVLAAKLSAPVLLVALVVGVVVSLVQAVFQVQDQTLTTVPKLILAGIVLAATGTWMLHSAVDFTQELFNQIPDIAS